MMIYLVMIGNLLISGANTIVLNQKLRYRTDYCNTAICSSTIFFNYKKNIYYRSKIWIFYNF